MSTELYLQGYSGSGADGLEVADVLKLFRVENEPDAFGFIRLAYDANNWCDLSITEENGRAVAIIISRPVEHQQLWTDVFAVLTRGPYVAFMPDSPAPVVVNADVEDHMPAGMRDALGTPIQVSTAIELSTKIVGR